MNRNELVKQAYAEGAFVALQQLGYEKNAAAQIAMKMAGDDDGIGALGGAGIGAGAGLAAGAGGAGLADLIMRTKLRTGELGENGKPGFGRPKFEGEGIGGLTNRAAGGLDESARNANNAWAMDKDKTLNKVKSKALSGLNESKLMQLARQNPRLAAALGIGGAGLALGGLAGGLAGGLSD